MGTRHLTVVVHKGEYKVAQYGQWDGYPLGQGKTIANFLQNQMCKPLFRDALDNTSFVEFNPYVRDLWTKCGADPDSDSVSMDVSNKFKEKYPEFSRDTGAKVLEIIQDKNGCKLRSELEFVSDSLFCEFAYVINMDDEVVEIYKGFNTEPLEVNERFATLDGKDAWDGTKYYPVKLVTDIPFEEFTVEAMDDLDKYLSPDEDEEEITEPTLSVVK